MNEKFYGLPEGKQQAILNAGYRVFAHNSYKNSPMSETAAEAGICKSLLFHYFRNKKELFIFLWDKGAEIIHERTFVRRNTKCRSGSRNHALHFELSTARPPVGRRRTPPPQAGPLGGFCPRAWRRRWFPPDRPR